MMTVEEISLPEKMPSSSATVDPQKAKAARRRRLEIKKLGSICKEAAQNGVVKRQQHPHPPEERCRSSDGQEEREGLTRESHGAVSVMGRRREMEDSVAVELGLVEIDSRRYDFFGVFDGHGGSHVAEACRDRMHSILREELRDGGTCQKDAIDWEMVMVRCFERMDREVGGGGGKEEVEEMTVGSTAVTAVVGEEEVVIANCGDSRAVICRNGVAIPLSIDHKPDRPDELARIEAAGGRVINWNGYRVLGVLATSRSIGDHYLKPYVSSIPEVTISKRTEEDEFLILASDGLWDVISNDVACQIVRRCLTGKIQRKSPDASSRISSKSCSRAGVAAALLTELAIAKGSKDNISVIVIELRKFRRLVCS